MRSEGQCLGEHGSAQSRFSQRASRGRIEARRDLETPEGSGRGGRAGSLDITSAASQRGYSITTNERGKIIRTIAAVRSKMKIRTRVSDGEFGSEILEGKKGANPNV